jgi:hypothetical protein
MPFDKKIDPPPPFEAFSGNLPYIFVSYARKDAAVVFPELIRLYHQGYRIWYDEGIEAGNNWPDKVAETLKKCDFFVVFITRNSVRSTDVQDEINFALDNDKPFLAIHLEETLLPDGLKLRMGRIQAILKYRIPLEFYEQKILKAIPESLKSEAPGPQPVPPIKKSRLIALGILILAGMIGIGYFIKWGGNKQVFNENKATPCRVANEIKITPQPTVAVITLTPTVPKTNTGVVPPKSMSKKLTLIPSIDPSGLLTVKAWTDKPVYKSEEKIRIYLQINKPAYIKVIYKDAAGNIVQLLPNPYRKDNYFNEEIVQLPSGTDQFELEVSQPFGAESIFVYASTIQLGEVDIAGTRDGMYQVSTKPEDLSRKIRGIIIKPIGTSSQNPSAPEYSEIKIDITTEQ